MRVLKLLITRGPTDGEMNGNIKINEYIFMTFVCLICTSRDLFEEKQSLDDVFQLNSLHD